MNLLAKNTKDIYRSESWISSPAVFAVRRTGVHPVSPDPPHGPREKMSSDHGTQVINSLYGDFCLLTNREIKRLIDNGVCQSPIEAMLGISISIVWNNFIFGKIKIVSKETDNKFELISQYVFQKYKIDWVLKSEKGKIFIECDGHDFHERTKEQAAHDRAKDRAIQLAGFPILRFTGSEIWRSPADCVVQIFNFLNSMASP